MTQTIEQRRINTGSKAYDEGNSARARWSAVSACPYEHGKADAG